MDRMIELEMAHLTLHYLQTLISHGSFPALRYELRDEDQRERFVAALQVALDLLDWGWGVLPNRLMEETNAEIKKEGEAE